MEDRFNRVYNYMLGKGFRVTHGMLVRPRMIDVPTIDVDRLGTPELNGCWVPYDPINPREKVWALILASRMFMTKYEQYVNVFQH